MCSELHPIQRSIGAHLHIGMRTIQQLVFHTFPYYFHIVPTNSDIVSPRCHMVPMSGVCQGCVLATCLLCHVITWLMSGVKSGGDLGKHVGQNTFDDFVCAGDVALLSLREHQLQLFCRGLMRRRGTWTTTYDGQRPRSKSLLAVWHSQRSVIAQTQSNLCANSSAYMWVVRTHVTDTAPLK